MIKNISNLGDAALYCDFGAEVNKQILLDKSFIKTKSKKLKILGNGDIEKALKVTADKFSKTAEEKIKKAGGEVIV